MNIGHPDRGASPRSGRKKEEVLGAFAIALRREQHVLRKDAARCFQQLYNRLRFVAEETPALQKRIGPQAAKRLSRTSVPTLMIRRRYRESEELVATVIAHSGKEGVWDCAVSSLGDFFVSAGIDNVRGGLTVTTAVKLWDLRTGINLHTLDKDPFVKACAISPCGRWLVSGGSNRVLRIWDVPSGSERANLQGHIGAINACAVSPDGEFVASASEDGTVRIWDVTSLACVKTLQGHTDAVNACAVSPDGKLVASASADRTVKLWDMSSLTCLRTLEGHSHSVTACTTSPDGRFIISGATIPDCTVKLWDRCDTSCRTLEGHEDSVLALAMSPDGRSIVSGSDDGILKVWDARTGLLRRTLIGHSLGVNACATTTDGRLIVSASRDGTIKLWELP